MSRYKGTDNNHFKTIYDLRSVFKEMVATSFTEGRFPRTIGEENTQRGGEGRDWVEVVRRWVKQHILHYHDNSPPTPESYLTSIPTDNMTSHIISEKKLERTMEHARLCNENSRYGHFYKLNDVTMTSQFEP